MRNIKTKLVLTLILITFSFQGYSQEVTITFLGQYNPQGEVRAFDIKDDRLFVGTGDYLESYNISDLYSITRMDNYFYGSSRRSQTLHIEVQDNMLYSSNGLKGLLLLDISDPSNIRFLESYQPGGVGFSSIVGDYVATITVVGYSGTTAHVANISDLDSIEERSYRLPFYSELNWFKLTEKALYIVAEKYYEGNYQGSELIILDVTTEVLVERFRLLSGFRGIEIKDNYLFTADTSNTIKVFDISDAFDPKFINEIPITNSYTASFYAKDNHLIVGQTVQKYDKKIWWYDIADISEIQLKDSLTLDTSISNSYRNTYRIENEKLFLAKKDTLEIYDLSDGAISFVNDLPFSKRFASLKIASDPDHSYLLTENHIKIFDISEKSNPRLISTISVSGLRNFYKDGHLIYVATKNTIEVFDITKPEEPSHNSSITVNDDNYFIVQKVYVRNNLAFISYTNGSVKIFDITDQKSPVELSQVEVAPGLSIIKMLIDSENLYLIEAPSRQLPDEESGMYIYDISNTSEPELLSFLKFPGRSYDMKVEQNSAFIAGGSEGVHIVDVSNKTNPEILSTFQTNGLARSVDYKNEKLYVSTNKVGLTVLDVSDKTEPYFLTEYNTPGSQATDLALLEDHIVQIDYVRGLYTLGVQTKDFGVRPEQTTLFQNYPNPFNNGTRFRYYLSTQSNVDISVYNILGKKIATLDNTNRPRGWHSFYYSPNNLSTGVYFVSLRTADRIVTNKILYIK